jgi:hypothetical protein
VDLFNSAGEVLCVLSRFSICSFGFQWSDSSFQCDGAFFSVLEWIQEAVFRLIYRLAVILCKFNLAELFS